jgi:hypothetical protein
MKKSLLMALASAITLSTAAPVMAADSPMGSVASFFGSVTAAAITTPQAMVVDTLYWMPLRKQRSLAAHFGDDKGWQQNIVATVIGVPWGMVWGVPTGFLRGAKHGLGVGWEKPFSTESFVVINNEEDK